MFKNRSSGPVADISPEMIDAAAAVLVESGRLEQCAGPPDDVLIKEILEAALAVTPPNNRETLETGLDLSLKRRKTPPSAKSAHSCT